MLTRLHCPEWKCIHKLTPYHMLISRRAYSNGSIAIRSAVIRVGHLARHSSAMRCDTLAFTTIPSGSSSSRRWSSSKADASNQPWEQPTSAKRADVTPGTGTAHVGISGGGAAPSAPYITLRPHTLHTHAHTYALDPPQLGQLGDTRAALDEHTYLYGSTEWRKTYESLGVDSAFCTALRAIISCSKASTSTAIESSSGGGGASGAREVREAREEMKFATKIQSRAIPAIFTGQDVVIGSETGSGKTLAYLLPLLQQCLHLKRAKQQKLEQKHEQQMLLPRHKRTKQTPLAVVCVPNKDLVAQVYATCMQVLNALPKHADTDTDTDMDTRADSSANVLHVHPVLSSAIEAEGEDYTQTALTPAFAHAHLHPDIVICTPSYLIKKIDGVGSSKDSYNSYNNNVNSSRSMNGSVASSGSKGAGLSMSGSIENLLQNLRFLVLDEADMLLGGSYQPQVEKIYSALKQSKSWNLRKQGSMSKHPIYPLQSILSAATIPTYGTKSLQAYISEKFPTAEVIFNQYYHCHHPQLTQTYTYCDDTNPLAISRVEMLYGMLTRTSGAGAGDGTAAAQPTMVFVNTANNAIKLANLLLDKYKLQTLQYHKLVNFQQRQESLKRFSGLPVDAADAASAGTIPDATSTANANNILICTDAASRGLDLPCVKRVIQHEFATNVVQHLHRVGRASRAGATGAADAIYDENNLDLLRLITKKTTEVLDTQEFMMGMGTDIVAVESRAGEKWEDDERNLSLSLPLAPPAAAADVEERVKRKGGIAAESIEQAFSRRRGLKGKIKKEVRRARREQEQEQEQEQEWR